MPDLDRLSPAGRYADPKTLARAANAPWVVCRILWAVAEGDDENIRLIRSPATDEETLRQRRAVIWAAKLHTSASLPEIGRALNRDHSAILRGLEEAKGLFLADPDFRHLCERIGRVVPVHTIDTPAPASPQTELPFS